MLLSFFLSVLVNCVRLILQAIAWSLHSFRGLTPNYKFQLLRDLPSLLCFVFLMTLISPFVSVISVSHSASKVKRFCKYYFCPLLARVPLAAPCRVRLSPHPVGSSCRPLGLTVARYFLPVIAFHFLAFPLAPRQLIWKRDFDFFDFFVWLVHSVPFVVLINYSIMLDK